MKEFFDYVNSYHSTIKYTWEWSKTKISYLDVLVSLEYENISIDVYCKPTDTHQYLDSRSCHSKDAKWGIPYGQALRYRKICDSDEVFEERLKELRRHFIMGGFIYIYIYIYICIYMYIYI